MSATEQIVAVQDLFKDATYVVPLYQRAYAWGENEILTLLRDISDYRARHPSSNYYIGSLVTYQRTGPDGGVDVTYELVDGQQRLTTLYIALTTLGEGVRVGVAEKLRFEARATSSADLEALARNGLVDADALQDRGIRAAVLTVRKARDGLVGDGWAFEKDDLEYLLKRVHLVRTTLPTTDLNHYFEVMNSRGEQLEKHEVVKARLMSRLNADSSRSATFAAIWDACTDLSRHIQGKFGPESRTALFGETWDGFEHKDFDALDQVLGQTKRGDSVGSLSGAETLDDVLRESSAGSRTGPSTDDDSERYGAIIDFPNLLLQVLALTERGDHEFTWGQATVQEVSLDDKHLVGTFEDYFKRREVGAAEVEKFAYNLLRFRFLFDRYVIKVDLSRESSDDSSWVLQRARRARTSARSDALRPTATFRPSAGEVEIDESSSANDDHRHVLMLQAMFQVTDSRRAYKNFLYAILAFLDDNPDPTANELAAELELLARGRLAVVVGNSLTAQGDSHEATILDQGTSVPHFILHYLDYLLWRKHSSDRESPIAAASFRFRYRNSIEHFYPQHPSADSAIEALPIEPVRIVDQFGNLALMSRGENSKRSNLAPKSKVSQFKSHEQSLKFQLMAWTCDTNGWDEPQIAAHGEDMREVLRTALESAEPTSIG